MVPYPPTMEHSPLLVTLFGDEFLFVAGAALTTMATTGGVLVVPGGRRRVPPNDQRIRGLYYVEQFSVL